MFNWELHRNKDSAVTNKLEMYVWYDLSKEYTEIFMYVTLKVWNTIEDKKLNQWWNCCNIC